MGETGGNVQPLIRGCYGSPTCQAAPLSHTHNGIQAEYGEKTSGGYSLGVDLEVIGPDPVEGVSDIKSPKITKYNAGGMTIKAVFELLNNRKQWGLFHPHYSAKMDYALDGKLSEIAVKAALTINMPKWPGYGKGSDAQKATWDDMWAHLLVHEKKHHTKFTDAVKEFLKYINDMELSRAEVKELWARKKIEWQAMQDKFDDDTDHGAKQGVVFDADADPEPEPEPK